MPHLFLAALLLCFCATAVAASPAATQPYANFVLDYPTPVDAALQSKLEAIDAKLREKFGMKPEDTNVGLLDLLHPRVAMIHPDHTEYAASVAKIGILYAYFKVHPEAATSLDPTTRHELGMMAKISSNEMASKFSHEIGLKRIQEILNADGFYDAKHGGGIWVGKHYGKGTERYTDPVSDNSHAINVRQVLRFWLLLERDKLISPQASATMREIFASPDLPHDDIKFVKALKGRPGVTILRKWGTWEDWLHDTAVIEGPGRKYILVGITHHPKGDEYLEALAAAVDDLMQNAK
jgi:beta-lactamase class A